MHQPILGFSQILCHFLFKIQIIRTFHPKFDGMWYFQKIITKFFDETFQDFFWKAMIAIGIQSLQHNSHIGI